MDIKDECICIVYGSERGTGFLFQEDYVLTSGHLFKEFDNNSEVSLHFINDLEVNAKLIEPPVYIKEYGIDYAILKLNTPIEHGSDVLLNYTDTPEADSPIVSKGFGETLSYLSTCTGKFVGPVYFNNQPDQEAFIIDSKQLCEKGYSGAPIFSSNLNAIIAVQYATTTKTNKAHENTVIALPLKRLMRISRVLRSIILEKQESKYTIVVRISEDEENHMYNIVVNSVYEDITVAPTSEYNLYPTQSIEYVDGNAEGEDLFNTLFPENSAVRERFINSVTAFTNIQENLLLPEIVFCLPTDQQQIKLETLKIPKDLLTEFVLPTNWEEEVLANRIMGFYRHLNNTTDTLMIPIKKPRIVLLCSEMICTEELWIKFELSVKRFLEENHLQKSILIETDPSALKECDAIVICGKSVVEEEHEEWLLFDGQKQKLKMTDIIEVVKKLHISFLACLWSNSINCYNSILNLRNLKGCVLTDANFDLSVGDDGAITDPLELCLLNILFTLHRIYEIPIKFNTERELNGHHPSLITYIYNPDIAYIDSCRFSPKPIARLGDLAQSDVSGQLLRKTFIRNGLIEERSLKEMDNHIHIFRIDCLKTAAFVDIRKKLLKRASWISIDETITRFEIYALYGKDDFMLLTESSENQVPTFLMEIREEFAKNPDNFDTSPIVSYELEHRQRKESGYIKDNCYVLPLSMPYLKWHTFFVYIMGNAVPRKFKKLLENKQLQEYLNGLYSYGKREDSIKEMLLEWKLPCGDFMHYAYKRIQLLIEKLEPSELTTWVTSFRIHPH